MQENNRAVVFAASFLALSGVVSFFVSTNANSVSKSVDPSVVNVQDEIVASEMRLEAGLKDLGATISDSINRPTPAPASYTVPIEHFFFHPLVAYPSRAFDGDSISQGFDDWFVTVDEFKKIMQSMYERGYILVGIGDAYENYFDGTNWILRRKTLILPDGKKPAILSIDDLNYYDYMRKNGTVEKLVVSAGGKIVTLSHNDAGEQVISDDNEIVPIMDTFILNHPDFSFNGAKGVIALTGFQGILGYRTQVGSKNRDAEIAAVAPVIQKLKETGWTFASHGFGHRNARDISSDAFAYDTNRWMDEVGFLVGETYVYIFPFGAHFGDDSAKLAITQNAGYRLLLGVGPHPYEKRLGLGLLATRRHFDGIALRQLRNLNLPFFDSLEIIDRTARGY